MPDFSKTIEVEAPRQAVMKYVSDVQNMPSYLPTVKDASMEDSETVHMEMKIDGKDMADSGYFRKSADDRLEWGSEDHDYHGEMVFSGSENLTTLTLKLHINPPPDLDKKMEEHSGGDWESRIDQGIDQALQAIKGQVEMQ